VVPEERGVLVAAKKGCPGGCKEGVSGGCEEGVSGGCKEGVSGGCKEGVSGGCKEGVSGGCKEGVSGGCKEGVSGGCKEGVSGGRRGECKDCSLCIPTLPPAFPGPGPPRLARCLSCRRLIPGLTPRRLHHHPPEPSAGSGARGLRSSRELRAWIAADQGEGGLVGLSPRCSSLVLGCD